MFTPSVQIAITMDNGTLQVMSFVTQSRSPTLPYGAVWSDEKMGRWDREPTDKNVLAEITKTFRLKDSKGLPLPQPVRWKRVEASDIPADRTYRNAWRHDGEKFFHDIEHAKQIHLDKVRRARTAALTELDRDWMKATGQEDQKTAKAIEAKRQALRDAPQTLDLSAVKTVEELKAIWPADLPR